MLSATDSAEALKCVGLPLRGGQELRAEALKLARENAARLVGEGKSQEAHDWLAREIEKRSYLESLRGELTGLETRAPSAKR